MLDIQLQLLYTLSAALVIGFIVLFFKQILKSLYNNKEVLMYMLFTVVLIVLVAPAKSMVSTSFPKNVCVKYDNEGRCSVGNFSKDDKRTIYYDYSGVFVKETYAPVVQKSTAQPRTMDNVFEIFEVIKSSNSQFDNVRYTLLYDEFGEEYGSRTCSSSKNCVEGLNAYEIYIPGADADVSDSEVVLANTLAHELSHQYVFQYKLYQLYSTVYQKTQSLEHWADVIALNSVEKAGYGRCGGSDRWRDVLLDEEGLFELYVVADEAGILDMITDPMQEFSDTHPGAYFRYTFAKSFCNKTNDPIERLIRDMEHDEAIFARMMYVSQAAGVSLQINNDIKDWEVNNDGEVKMNKAYYDKYVTTDAMKAAIFGESLAILQIISYKDPGDVKLLGQMLANSMGYGRCGYKEYLAQFNQSVKQLDDFCKQGE